MEGASVRGGEGRREWGEMKRINETYREAEAKKLKDSEQSTWMGELDPQISMALQMFADPADPTALHSDLTKVAEGYVSLPILLFFFFFLLFLSFPSFSPLLPYLHGLPMFDPAANWVAQELLKVPFSFSFFFCLSISSFFSSPFLVDHKNS